ncbi:MAG TPA: DNA polymerase III subunit alpha [Stackebrandtia sp.]|jgi:DNA polymerase-3 subunit alpha|uniref:DNA polymerase III subunit alpha n=1 Tax=Stackebrandtia sp. TaxID=2023065 RepID=UPI002D49F2BA|nr:DNA polymerase III subunit alpha [Stackebrandtia sp.]HZE37421.1 DNA polymerase III subunit alpha [Stackebrandtia sp.]
MSKDFVHLHVHSEYSMLDGAAKMRPMFSEVKRLGMSSVALTDHGNMFGAYEFYQEAKKADVKPIIGIEAYLAPGDRGHKKPVRWGRPDQKSDDVSSGGAYTHMTMWAASSAGLRNLLTLSSLASFEGMYHKPRMDVELLSAHHEGILATTGCPSGEVQTRLRLEQPEEALAAAAKYQDIFGKENFFLELMHHDLEIERRVRQGLIDIGKKLGLPAIATNDSHYVHADDAEHHEALLCVGSGKTLTDPNRFKLEGGGYYIKSAAQMREYWDAEVPDACDNTLLIAERVGSYDEVFAEVDRMPRFPLKAGETEDSVLRAEVEQYAPQRFPEGMTQEYRDRVDFELGVMSEMGFSGYFLVVGDLVRWAKSQAIPTGPGRGSATGSLVAYILQITDLDPIEHKLIFERFLNPERVSPPDIDLDFDERRRGEVMRYTIDKWGEENVAQVITFGTIKTKAALKDSARAHLGQPGFSVAERITKALPPPVAAQDIPLSGIVDPEHERYNEAAEIRSLVENDPEVKQIFDTARGLEGLIRNAGVHACAVIISAVPLMGQVPLWMRPDGSVITGWDYPSCESMGLLKMDFLGLRNLTVIGDAIENVKRNRGVELSTETISLDDPVTYELLGRGDTMGVFQLDGTGMRELLRRMQPTKFGDIAAALALYRPGPMAANAHTSFAERSNGRQAIEPIHPELKEALEPILSETFHLLVYQEQVMAIAQQLAGYTLGGADLLRRAMGKKKKEIIEKEFEKFSDGMASNGYSKEATQTLWDVMLPFAGYAFNKSHTAGYGLVSYWTAFLKANYPAEYMAALLTSVGDNKDKSAQYLADCRKLGIKVLPPDVNSSVRNFSAVGGDIRFGLGAIRNVGTGVVDSIVTTRQKKGAYESFSDFLQKVELPVCNKRVIESLIKAGAFDSMGHSRRVLCEQHETLVESIVGVKRKEAEGQFDLFGGLLNPEQPTEAGGKDDFSGEEWPRKTALEFEREMLGLYVSGHPLEGAEMQLRRASENRIADLLAGEQSDGTSVTIAGIISGLERRVTKQGKPWAKATVEDLDAAIEVLFFPKTYEFVGPELAQDLVVSVRGKLNKRDQETSIVAMAMDPLEINESDLVSEPTLTLNVQLAKVNERMVDELKSVLRGNRGDMAVRVRLRSGAQETLLALDDSYKVASGPSLTSELKSLLGGECLE